jgi:molybdopterin-guanine dinucleotide biosynthesis protein A
MALTAVLLAGGESRRMGRDKATLVWRGRPLWEWQIEKLRKLCPGKILVSAKSDLPWRPADVDLVLDVTPSRGPLSGLAAALACTETEHLLALAVDMPFMTADHLRELCGITTEGMGVIPIIDGKAEPLAAVYPKGAGPVLLEPLHGTNFSLQPVVEKLIALGMLGAAQISGSARDLYKSINEPHDLD